MRHDLGSALRRATAALIFLALTTAAAAAAGDKLTPVELIQRHRESLGSPEALASRWGTAGSALARVDFIVGGSGRVQGAALFASEDPRMTLYMDLGQASYAKEHFIFDGDDVRIGFMRPGTRSPLAEFLFTYKHLLTNGLLGGALRVNWPLFQDLGQAKLKYRGLKKTDGEKLHRLAYRVKGGTDTEIQLYFEPETFRHVRSEYEVTIAPPIGLTPAESSQQRRTRTKVVETFSNFTEVEGLTLPTVWEIDYSTTGTRNSLIWKWTIEFNKLAVNQRLEEKYYSLTQTASGEN